MYYADLHLHSHFSMATSSYADLPHLDWWARRKGLRLLGTGDFTHPAWRAQLKEQLQPAGEGLYQLREDFRLPQWAPGSAPYFVITGEISCIYQRDGKTRKVHNLLVLPSLEAAEILCGRLQAIGNLQADGRPILRLDSRDLLEILLDSSPEGELIPAHIWTPHFSVLGAFTCFPSVQACFADLSGYIHAVETGLSSDPAMNWQVSGLDSFTLLSHSDAHSPAKLGREANILDSELSYSGLLQAIRTGNGLIGTVEFYPEEGKYYRSGHRKCGICLTPREADNLGNLCPVCGKKLTRGVESQIASLADQPGNFPPPKARPFYKLMPLADILSLYTGTGSTTKKVLALYEQMLCRFGTEFTILRNTEIHQLQREMGSQIAQAIYSVRTGTIVCQPGFDGQFGRFQLPFDRS